MVRWLIAVAGILLGLVAWYGSLFGPRELFLFGIPAFFAPILTTLGLPKVPEGPPREGGPALRRVLRGAVLTLGLVTALSFVALFASARLDGVADTPAFEEKSVYALENHGTQTEVSRLRYVVASASFSTGWVSLVLLFNVLALHRAVYNQEL